MTVARRSDQETANTIIKVVLRMIESGGLDAVDLRKVASSAHLSLATIYRLFPSRDDLLVSAVEAWMADHSWADLAIPEEGDSFYDAVMRVLGQVFEPWERDPWALEAFFRVLELPQAEALRKYAAALGDLFRDGLGVTGSSYLADTELILTHVTCGVMANVVNGRLAVTEIIPTLERVVRRLTGDNEVEANRAAALWSGNGSFRSGVPLSEVTASRASR